MIEELINKLYYSIIEMEEVDKDILKNFSDTIAHKLFFCAALLMEKYGIFTHIKY